MKVQILGCHQGEASDLKLVTFLIDEVLAVDAGSLTATTTLSAQESIRAVLLTHHHLDHIKDLPIFGFNMLQRRRVQVFSTAKAQEALLTHLLNGLLWPNLSVLPSPDKPVFAFRRAEAGQVFEVEGYEVTPVAVNHSIETLGYQVRSPDDRSFFYSGDTGPGLEDVWRRISPDLMAIEVTFPNRMEKIAVDYGHLTPGLLEQELRSFLRLQGRLPAVAVVHVNPYLVEEIRSEIENVSRQLKANIFLAYEGMTISI
ncbi:MAG: MBL fold metallo-hydrolase [Chloroflexi bacterium]|nr:MBL fold metallo-hydrolase [Chloroflexota bacterium]